VGIEMRPHDTIALQFVKRFFKALSCVKIRSKINPQFKAMTLGRIALLALVWLLLFFDTLRRVVDDWRVDENYSHGFLVPFLSAYALWAERDGILASASESQPLPGVGMTVVSILLLFAGIVGAELYLARIGMLLSVAGLVVAFGGLRMLRKLVFPLGIWLLAIPIPNVIFYRIAFPLQLIASENATRVIRLFGVPALREGNVIELAQMKLQVVEACSGIRSLISMTLLAVVYAYWFEKGLPRRVLVILAIVPIAVLANAARVAVTGLIAHHSGPAAAEGFMHAFSGWVVFLLEGVLLLAVAKSFDLISRLRSRL
jgi:exosortase